MSEQIREQVSAFLDGELPGTEAELLLKRLTRDGELRESFGRYALIGEAIRGSTSHGLLTKGFASRVNLAIDGEPLSSVTTPARAASRSWWRPLGGVAVAAGVAAIAVLALQQRADVPSVASAPSTVSASIVPAQIPVQVAANHEALSYTTPVSATGAPATLQPARLTNYVFAHSKYSSPLGQRGVLADMLIEDDDQAPFQQPPLKGHTEPVPAAP